jgi:hypothetical protein
MHYAWFDSPMRSPLIVYIILLLLCLGGHRGFGKVIWTVKEYVRDGDSPYITFFYHSFDGEQGKIDAHAHII